MSIRSFSERLSRRRVELGLTLKEAGEAMGTSGAYLCALEQRQHAWFVGSDGKQGPTLSMLLRFCKVYGLTMQELADEWSRPEFATAAPMKREEITYAKLR